ncbi:MAG: SDR family NAD(P)-dependent oxidoreductase [Candidatus Hydrogenedentota bacterium]
MLLNPFKGKNILITGGSKGIGLCMAKELAALKANIAIIARDKTNLALAQREIEEAGKGIRCLAYACDVTDADTLSDYINMVRYEFGHIDGIIANSGYCHPGNFHEIEIDDMDRQIDVNLKGVVYTLRFGVPHLLENGGGFIAITSSPAGNAGIFGFSIYGATKSALNIMSHILRAEYRDKNIRLHLLLPSDTDCPGYAEEVPLYPKETQAILEGGALLQPEKVAKKFIRGIANNKKTITAGFSSRLVLLIMRYAPFIWDLYTKSKISSVNPKNAEGEIFASEWEDQEMARRASSRAAAEAQSGEHETGRRRSGGAEAEAETITPDPEPEYLDPTDLSDIVVGLEIENLKPFLDRITKYTSGLQPEIATILMGVADMDTLQDKSWDIDTGRNIPLRIDISMNPDDSIDMRFYTNTKLSLIIDQEFTRMFGG